MNNSVPKFWDFSQLELKVLQVICNNFNDKTFNREQLYDLNNQIGFKRGRIYQIVQDLEKKHVFKIDTERTPHKIRLKFKVDKIKHSFHSHVDEFFEG